MYGGVYRKALWGSCLACTLVLGVLPCVHLGLFVKSYLWGSCLACTLVLGVLPCVHLGLFVKSYLWGSCLAYILVRLSRTIIVDFRPKHPMVINPIHPIGNSLKKQKSMYIVLTPSIKPSI